MNLGYSKAHQEDLEIMHHLREQVKIIPALKARIAELEAVVERYKALEVTSEFIIVEQGQLVSPASSLWSMDGV